MLTFELRGYDDVFHRQNSLIKHATRMFEFGKQGQVRIQANGSPKTPQLAWFRASKLSAAGGQTAESHRFTYAKPLRKQDLFHYTREFVLIPIITVTATRVSACTPSRLTNAPKHAINRPGYTLDAVDPISEPNHTV